MSLITALDSLAFLASFSALVLLITKRTQCRTKFEGKTFIGLLLCLGSIYYFFLIIEWSHISVSFDPIEDVFGALLPMSWGFLFYTLLQDVHRADLRVNKLRYKSLVQNIPGAVYQCTYDQDYTMEFMSDEITDISGYPKTDFIANHVRSFASIIHPEDREHVAKTVSESIAERKLFSLEYRIIHRDGSVQWVYERGRARSTDTSKPIILEGVIMDITQKKTLLEQKQQAEQQIFQLQKMDAIGQLAGGIAHDFNNQLTALLGYADLLAMRLKEKKHELKLLGSMHLSIHHARKLTEQLLAFSRKGKIHHEVVDLHQVVHDVKLIMERSIDKKIDIRTVLSAPVATTMGDPSQIHNMLLNVALNARDAMPDGGEMLFESDEVIFDEMHAKAQKLNIASGTYMCLSVTDTGCGIDAQTIQYIFEPFFTTKEEGKGTGMGLSAAYGTMKSHKGAIAAYSEVGRGTTMKLYFPVTHGVAPKHNNIITNSPHHGKGHVLFVDDNQTVCDVAAMMLAQLGYDVTVFTKPQKAVGFFKDHFHAIQFVIIDMIMPHMNGHELYIALKDIQPDVKVLLASGYTLNGEAQKALDAGVQGFMQKPFTLDQLSSALTHVLA